MRGVIIRFVACLLAFTALATLSTASQAGARVSDPSPLDGRWRQTAKATTQELVAHGMPPTVARALAKLPVTIPAVELHGGHVRWFDLATGRVYASGTYVVRGDRVGFSFSTYTVKAPPGVSWLRWSVFRDRLTFSALPGRTVLLSAVLHPWTRVR
jgi:hypothetical protein